MASQRSLPLVIMETGEGRCGMIDTVRVGKTIQQLRKAKGMSQEVLSGLAGLDRTHYSKIERGLRSPNLDTLFKISNALGMEPHELVAIIEREAAENPNRVPVDIAGLDVMHHH